MAIFVRIGKWTILRPIKNDASPDVGVMMLGSSGRNAVGNQA